MAQNLGAQGVSNMQAGQNMMNTGVGMAQGAGDQQRLVWKCGAGSGHSESGREYFCRGIVVIATDEVRTDSVEHHGHDQYRGRGK